MFDSHMNEAVEITFTNLSHVGLVQSIIFSTSYLLPRGKAEDTDFA
jgi:hypothetical protein